MQVPEGWKVKKFGSIFNIKSGLGFKYSEYTESGIPLVKIDNVSHGYISWDNLTFLPSDYCKKHADLVLDEGDILLALNRPITQGELKIARVTSKDAPSILYQRVGKIFPLSSSTSNDYYYYVFQKEIFNFVQRNAVGSDQPFISTTELKKVNLPAPPLKEQQKIAQILSIWDKAITTTEQLLTNSQQQKKALMQQLLTGKKRLLDDSGQRFSEEWKRVQLKDCAECLDTQRVPLNSEQRLEMKGNIPYWGANGVVDYINQYIFDETIVLLAEDGGYFDEYSTRPIANLVHGKSWVNNHAHVLRAMSNCINEWLYFSLVHKNILGFVNAGTRAKLNQKDMSRIAIYLPCIEEQQKIATVLTAADNEITRLQQKLDQLKQEKKALMQQLLTGKRRVKVEEVA